MCVACVVCVWWFVGVWLVFVNCLCCVCVVFVLSFVWGGAFDVSCLFDVSLLFGLCFGWCVVVVCVLFVWLFLVRGGSVLGICSVFVCHEFVLCVCVCVLRRRWLFSSHVFL